MSTENSLSISSHHQSFLLLKGKWLVIEGNTHMTVILSCQGRMCDAFNFQRHVSLLTRNLFVLRSRGNMAFKLPSFGLLERTKRS